MKKIIYIVFFNCSASWKHYRVILLLGKSDIRNQNFMTIIVLKTKKANRIGWMIIKKMQLITFFHSIVKHRAS